MAETVQWEFTQKGLEKISSQLDALDTKIGNVDKSTEKMSSKSPFKSFLLANVASNAINGLTNVVQQGATELFNYAGTVEQMKVAWDSIAKSQAPAIMDSVNKVASKTPYSIQEIDKSFKSLYNAGYQDVGQLEKVFTVLGDTASGVGAPVDQVTRAFSQMASKGKVTGEEMLQLSEAGIPAWKLLADAMGLSVEQVQDLSSKGKLGKDSLDLLLGSMEKSFGGGMQKQAETFNGKMSTLKDNVLNALVPAFTSLQKAIMPVVDYLINAFGNFDMSSLSSSLSPVGEAITKIGEAFASGFGPDAKSIVDGLGNSFNLLKTTMNTLANSPVFTLFVTLSNVLGAVLGVALNSIVILFNSLLTIFNGIASNPIFQGAITMLTNALMLALPVIQQIGQFLVDAFNNPLIQFALNMIGQTIGVILGIAIGTISIIISVISSVVGVVISIMSAILSVISSIINAIIGVWNSITAPIMNVFNSVRNTVSNVMNSITSAVAGVVNGIKDAFNGVKTSVEGVFNGIKDGAKNAVDGILGFFTGIGNKIGEFFSGALDNFINSLPGPIKAALGHYGTSIKTPQFASDMQGSVDNSQQTVNVYTNKMPTWYEAKQYAFSVAKEVSR